MVSNVSSLFLLLCAYQLKHFLADFPFQSSFMLGKFKAKFADYVWPLTDHCLVHAFFTYMIAAAITMNDWHFGLKMAALDFSIHFVMDRIKASPLLLGRYKALSGAEFATATPRQLRDNKYFWWALGFDQMVHGLTHLWLVYLIAAKAGWITV